jgi:hypothetical protein
MTDFFASLKDDLTDRRLLPLVIVVGALLAAALAYALLGGGSGAAPAVPSSPLPAIAASGKPISQVQTGVTGAIAETANGTVAQRRGKAINPFRPIPGTKTTTTVAVAKVGPSSSSSGSSSGSSASSTSTSQQSSGSGSSTSSGTPKPKPAPAKTAPKTIYNVAIEFGPITEPATPLQPYAALSKPTPLPSASETLIEFLGVTANGSGHTATFALVGEAILHGEAACHPSQTQCQLITLKQGATEQLAFVTATGQPAALYELRVVSIAAVKAGAAAVSRVMRAQADLAQEPGGSDSLLGAAGMRFSSQPGVIVFAGHSPFGAHSAPNHGR